MNRIFLLFGFVILTNCVFAQIAEYKTLTYFKNDTTSLELDLFLPDQAGIKDKVPVVIFVHGGGFKNGNRESAHDICHFLAQNGIAAATITYTLYMADKSFSCDGILTEKVRAIQLAANQVWQATQFLIQNQEDYQVNTSQIFLAGSSAGAEAILQANYWDKGTMGIYPLNLPEQFKYAGVISGAGAIIDINLITSENQVPGLFFHGTCDKLVPYNIAPHHYCKGNVPGWLMLFGAHAIHERLCLLNGKSYLMTYCGGGHEYSWKPFTEERENILWFIQHSTLEEKFQIHSVIPTGKTCELSGEYDFCK